MYKSIIAVALSAFALGALAVFAPGVQAQSVTAHKLVIQVTENDEGAMTRALGNAENAYEIYSARGETLDVEIVTYGPGITMLRDDLSPVKERITEVSMSVPGLTLSMCNNSKQGAERREGREIPVIEGVQIVPAGIVRVMELQEQGYVYAKP